MQGKDLQRVIPVIQPLGEHLTVVSLELYSDGVVVRYIDDRGFPASPADLDSREIELKDDTESPYFHAGGSSHATVETDGSHGALLGESLFTPAPSAAAARLRILADGSEVEVTI